MADTAPTDAVVAGTDAGHPEAAGSPLTLLLAVDDDRPSHRAAAAIARWFPHDARVVALHVGPIPVAAAWPDVGGPGLVGYPYATVGAMPGDDEEFERRALAVAQRAASIADAKPRVEHGDPVDTICQVAAEIEADLIVVGTGDRSWLSRLVDPSVGANVVAKAPCSVLVVRGHRDT